jgi:hypothetical protein
MQQPCDCPVMSQADACSKCMHNHVITPWCHRLMHAVTARALLFQFCLVYTFTPAKLLWLSWVTMKKKFYNIESRFPFFIGMNVKPHVLAIEVKTLLATFTHTHTHTHTHTNIVFLSLSHIVSLSITHIVSLYHIVSLSHTHSLSLSHTHTHRYVHADIWLPWTNLLRWVDFYIENIIYLFNKTSYLNEDINCA